MIILFFSMSNNVKDWSYLRRHELEYELRRRGLKPEGTVNELIEQLRQSNDVTTRKKITQPDEVSLAADAIAAAFEELVDVVRSGVVPTVSQLRRMQARCAHYSDRISDLEGVDGEQSARFAEARQIVQDWIRMQSGIGESSTGSQSGKKETGMGSLSENQVSGSKQMGLKSNFAKLKNPLQDKLDRCKDLSVESVKQIVEVLKFTLELEQVGQAIQLEPIEIMQLMAVATTGRLREKVLKCIQQGGSWRELRKSIGQLMAPRAFQEVVGESFWREQQISEPINQYVARVRDSVKVFELEFTEYEVVRHILSGLNLETRQRGVFRSTPNTFSELDELVTHLQAIQLLDDRRQVQHEIRVSDCCTKPSNSNVQSPPRNRYGTERSNRKEFYGKVKCWHCGKEGHVKTGCPEARMSQGQL